ncbi:hypothetical protein FVER14953_21076 [Fusarium verticillioides]|nr:hypothetical protein FVER14953_21076 [Fusarium verticillioides]
MGGGEKVPYPKHVWSPAGGWYAQPANWRANTLIAGVVMAGIVAVTWKFSAGREQWAHRPEQGQWYASRHWSKQLKQWDQEDQGNASKSE